MSIESINLHNPIIREKNNSTFSIIFCHGILGSPHHFHFLLDLVPQSFSLYNILLDGHGGTPKDFSNTSMKKWEKQIENLLIYLTNKEQKIIFVGHSMGTLFGINFSYKYKNIIKLFLLNPPMKIHYALRGLRSSFKVFFNFKDFETIKTKEDCSIYMNKNIFLYFGWIPRFLELFKKINLTREIIDKTSTPSIIFQSYKDELVSNKSIKYFVTNYNYKVVHLYNSGHYFYDSNDEKTIINEFNGMLKSLI